MLRIILSILMFSSVCYAQLKINRVALIDTGYNTQPMVNLCPDGHYDFVTNKEIIPSDTNGHGTYMARIIAANAEKPFCIIVLKVFFASDIEDSISKAILRAIKYKVDIINMSLNGAKPLKKEHNALRTALKSKIKIFVAAGNDGKNLDLDCSAYPACYKDLKLNVVGGFDSRSNTGSIITQFDEFCYEDICGTSVSTAIATGKYLWKSY